MSLFDYSPGQQLTRGDLLYVVVQVDEKSVTFTVQGFDGVRCVSRKQFERITKGAKLVTGTR